MKKSLAPDLNVWFNCHLNSVYLTKTNEFCSYIIVTKKGCVVGNALLQVQDAKLACKTTSNKAGEESNKFY